VKLEEKIIHLAGMLDQFAVGALPPEYKRLKLKVELRKLESKVKKSLEGLKNAHPKQTARDSAGEHSESVAGSEHDA
jgi:hypothetical protein